MSALTAKKGHTGMDAALARQILVFAKERQSYEAPIPEEDDALVTEASTLIAQATIAWNRNQARGPEVEGVLRLANPGFDGTGDYRDGAAPDAEPRNIAEAPLPEPAAPGGGDEPPAPDVPDVAEEEPEPQPDPQPEPEPVNPDEMRARQVPWAEYDDDSEKVIRDALDAALSEPDADDILAHVWAYESANKKRARILGHLAKIAEQRQQQPEPQPETEPEAPQEAPAAPQTPAEDSPDYADLIAEVEAQIASERLHAPEPPTEAAPVLPYDYSRVSDKDIRELHGAFGAFAYYADTRVQLHERIAAHARQQADEIARELLIAVANYDEKGKERRLTQIEAEIESTPAVAELRTIQRRHETLAASHRRERDSYNRTVEFLSRQESMRHNEFLRSQR